MVDSAFARRADQVVATYDGERGYPTRISIDWKFATADDEITYIIRDLRVR